MKKNLFVFLAMLSLLVIIPISSILLSQQNQDVRSRASEQKILPILPPLSPFIRVGTTKDHVKKGELLPVYVTAKTNGQAAVEAQVVLTYDPNQFLLDEKNLRNDNVFPVMQVSSMVPGKVVFSIFVDTQNGYEPVQLLEEKTIATLFLTVVGEPSDAAVRLVKDGEEKTQLFSSRDPETGEVPDILSSTQDVIIHID